MNRSNVLDPKQQSKQVYVAQFMHSGLVHDLQRRAVLFETHWRHRSLGPALVDDSVNSFSLFVYVMLPAASTSPPQSSEPIIFRNWWRLSTRNESHTNPTSHYADPRTKDTYIGHSFFRLFIW